MNYNQHKQEVIDGFIMAVIPALIKKGDVDEDGIFQYIQKHEASGYAEDALAIAEELFKAHETYCPVCKEKNNA